MVISLNIPPEFFKYLNDGGAGSRLVIIIFSNFPISPFSIAFFKEKCPENGLPARFTVHVVDFPDEAASYEFYSVGLLQKNR